MTHCTHPQISAWCDQETGERVRLWSCTECCMKFYPADEVHPLLDALTNARDWIAADRQSFVEAASIPGEQNFDELDRAALESYDGILAKIDAAMAAGQSDERREG